MGLPKLEKTLTMFRRELIEIGVFTWDPAYAIFGSASLVMHGALSREPGDVDVMMTRFVWGRLLDQPGWFVETPKAGDPPILSFEQSPTPIHGFFDWSDRHVEMDVEYLIQTSEEVPFDHKTYRCIPVVAALNHKKYALKYGTKSVAKHKPDVAAVEAWLESRKVAA